MPLDIYSPNQFRSTGVQFTPTLDIPEFDLSSIDELSKTLINIEDKKIKNIESNFEELNKLEDQFMGIDGGTAYGKSLLSQASEELGVSENTFKFSMDQLRDPFHNRQVQSTLNSYLQDDRVKEAVIEGQTYKELSGKTLRKIQKEQGGDMATVFKNHLNDIRSDPNSKLSVFDISPENYTKINLQELMSEDIKELVKEFPNVQFIPREGAPGGYVIIDETQDLKMSLGEFIDQSQEKYIEDPVVRNNWLALNDPYKPFEERMIGDEEAINKEIEKAGATAYKKYGGSRTIKSHLKEDVRGNVKFRRKQNEILSESQTNDKIRLKTTTGAGTLSHGGASNVDLEKQRSQLGLEQDHAFPQLQAIKAGLDVSDINVLRAIRQAAENSGEIPQEQLNELMRLNTPPKKPVSRFEETIISLESNGDPNALYGYSNRNGKQFADKQVTEMSVKDVFEFQRDKSDGNYGDWVKMNNPKSWTSGKVGEGELKPDISTRDKSKETLAEAVASGKYSYRSTPAGEYQIVGDLLSDAIDNRVVSEDELFTKDAQRRVYQYKMSEILDTDKTIDEKVHDVRTVFEGIDNAIINGKMTEEELVSMIDGYGDGISNPGQSAVIDDYAQYYGRTTTTSVGGSGDVNTLADSILSKESELNRIEKEDLFDEVDKQPLIKEIDDLKEHKERVGKMDTLIDELNKKQKGKLNKYVDELDFDNIVTDVGKEVKLPQMNNKNSKGNVINSLVTLRKTKENPPRYQINGEGPLYTQDELKKELKNSNKYHKSR